MDIASVYEKQHADNIPTFPECVGILSVCLSAHTDTLTINYTACYDTLSGCRDIFVLYFLYFAGALEKYFFLTREK